MQIKPLTAALIAAAFAFPLVANAGGAGKHTGDKQASAQSSSANGGTASFASLDKNGDGFISRDEAAGSPHAADFVSLDKNSDGRLSKAEHAAASKAVRSSGNQVSTNQSASTQPGTATPPGTSSNMPNSPPPAGNTQGTTNKTY